MSNINCSNLFSVNGIVAVITGGGTGLHTQTSSAFSFLNEFRLSSKIWPGHYIKFLTIKKVSGR